MPRWNADHPLQVHYLYAPLRIYTFQIRGHEGSRTTNDRSEGQLPRSILEERVRRRYVLDHRQTGAVPVQSAYLTLNSNSKELHPRTSQPGPGTPPYSRASARAYVAHELRRANRTRPIRPTRELRSTRTLAKRDQHGASLVALLAL
jgi:hypothetical protein